MGAWNVIMPLLSTLAALIIIVHSFDEGMERDPYYHDVSPRLSEPGSPDYDQSWRAVEVQPMMQQSGPADVWDDVSPQEPPRRRRPGRKRKRRPQNHHHDDLTHDETKVFLEERQGPHSELEPSVGYETTEATRRRRKRPEMRNAPWIEEPQQTQRTLRRRGHRRKRPNPEYQEQLDETTIVRPQHQHRPIQEDEKVRDEGNKWLHRNAQKEYRHRQVQYDITNIDADDELIIDGEVRNSFTNIDEGTDNEADKDKSLSEISSEINFNVDSPSYISKLHDKIYTISNDEIKQQEIRFQYFDGLLDLLLPQTPGPEQVTELDISVYDPYGYIDEIEIRYRLKKQKAKMDEKMRSDKIIMPDENDRILGYMRKCMKKSITASQEINNWKAQFDVNMEESPLDAASLKELLKKSDGSSLSEILQQRNLSLADLLNGRQKAISALQTAETMELNIKEDQSSHEKHRDIEKKYTDEKLIPDEVETGKTMRISSPKDTTISSINKTSANTSVENQQSVVLDISKNNNENKLQRKDVVNMQDSIKSFANGNTPKISTRRRLSPGRRRQRIKGPANNTISNSTFVSLHPNRRPIENLGNLSSIPKEAENLKETAGVTNNNDNNSINITNKEAVTLLPSTTVSINTEKNIESSVYDNHTKVTITLSPIINVTSTQESIQNFTDNFKVTTKSMPTTTTRHIEPIEIFHSETERNDLTIPMIRPKIVMTNSELRRKVLTNRLKKKRLKQKNSTVDPEEIGVKDLFGMANLVSASEFIARIQSPDTTIATTALEGEKDFISSLDDVTVSDYTTANDIKTTRNIPLSSTIRSTTTYKTRPTTTTEESAKIEIDEIFNDSHSSARLSKILSERNMTINELVEHRERGSSQVHLADIFHNTSREPNPPEPFLSKSLIEPISKEIYPLRALLEANHHDPNLKGLTLEPNPLHNTNIPLTMDFGNNVNENSENLGIVSLFNRFNTKLGNNKSKIKTDSDGTPYFTSVTAINESNETKREGRDIDATNDMITLKQIFSNIKMDYQNKTHNNSGSILKEKTPDMTTKSIHSDEDLDGDGLIVLEDLQHLNEIAQMSNERMEVKMQDLPDTSLSSPGLLEKIPSNTKSVTVATATIAGLTMVLFLLTYIGFKWKNQRNIRRKKESFTGERIPTPVFENRKLNKNNCSNRSISPMLSSSNIYTISTLDSRNGKGSPDYMWDSLRKSFQ